MFGCVWMEGVEVWFGLNGWNDVYVIYYGGVDVFGI